MKKSTAVLSLIFSFLPPVASLAQPQPPEKLPATQPSTQSTTQPAPDALKALADLAAKPKLLLTHDATSAHEKFSFALAINPPAGGQCQSTTVLVVRDGARIGVVVGAKGLPCYYMTGGLMIGVDPKNPGKLMMHEGGSIQLLFGGKDAGSHSHLSYSVRPGENSIILDPATMLTSISPKVVRADYRPELQRLGIKTDTGDNLKIRLARPDKPDAYPIESLMLQSPGPNGLTFAFGNVTPNVALKQSIASRTADDVRKLGIPIRTLTDEDLAKEFVALARADFAENEAEQEAAEKLRGLFPDDAPPEQR